MNAKGHTVDVTIATSLVPKVWSKVVLGGRELGRNKVDTKQARQALEVLMGEHDVSTLDLLSGFDALAEQDRRLCSKADRMAAKRFGTTSDRWRLIAGKLTLEANRASQTAHLMHDEVSHNHHSKVSYPVGWNLRDFSAATPCTTRMMSADEKAEYFGLHSVAHKVTDAFDDVKIS